MKCILYALLIGLSLNAGRLNIGFNVNNFVEFLQGIHYNMNMYLSFTPYVVKANGLFNSLYGNSTYVFLQDSQIAVSPISANKLHVMLYLQPIAICVGNCSVKYFGVVNKTYMNFVIVASEISLLFQFDMGISYDAQTVLMTVASNVSVQYPKKSKMSVIEDFYPYTDSYFSSWIAFTGNSLMNKVLQLSMNDMINSLSSALKNMGLQIPNNVSFDLLNIDETVLQPPPFSNSFMQLTLNGSIYADNVSYTDTAQPAIPANQSGANCSSYQFIIDQSLFQDQLTALYSLNGFHFDDSFMFTDLTIYNITCSSSSVPIISIQPSDSNITFNYTCSVYTDKLSNFQAQISTLVHVNISFASDRPSVNSVKIVLVSSELLSCLITGSLNYGPFLNHIKDIQTTMKIVYSQVIDSIPLPTFNSYTLINAKTHYYDGYAVVCN